MRKKPYTKSEKCNPINGSCSSFDEENRMGTYTLHNVRWSVKSPIDDLILSNVGRADVASLSKTVAKEFAQYNILVNTICPGFISTQRTLELDKPSISQKKRIPQKEVEPSFVSDIPLQRMGTPDEFANLAVFLVSKKASYITGIAIQVDGGKYPGLLIVVQ